VNNLPPSRIIELARERNGIRRGRVTDFAKKLFREFGIDPKKIDTTIIESGTFPEEEDSVADLRKKIVKAGMSVLRKAFADLLLQTGIVALKSPLPSIGYWESDSTVLEIGTNGHLITTKSTGSKGTTHVDQLANIDLIDALEKALEEGS